VDAALQRAKIPRDAVSLLVMNVDGRSPPNLAWRTHQAMNPASVMKLVTTYAALDQLGPAYVWRTPVYLGGPVVDGACAAISTSRARATPSWCWSACG
jgi:D-alanyl-D-alanine carboxypeptidase/D-alanyl-D-alanine-endopeptidase (penicillin-binding protein 4)